MTKHRIRDGRIRDTIVADMLRTRTMVVGRDLHGFPRAARNFVRKNFVSIGEVRVPGRILSLGQTTFNIDVPADYEIIGRREVFTGMLDGRAYDGSRPLASGVHSLSAVSSDAAFALLWSRAADRGYSPFGIVHKGRNCHRRNRKPMACNPGSGCT
jgi:hypothetical protein